MSMRSSCPITVKIMVAAVVMCRLGLGSAKAVAPSSDDRQPAAHAMIGKEGHELGRVRVGLLIYANGKREVCFSNGFLDAAAREASVNTERECVPVHLSDEAVFDYPLLVLAGQGPFELSEAEKRNLAAYLRRGGFLLASASCSSAGWGESFEQVMSELFADQPLRPLSLDHPIFHSLYTIDHIPTRKGSDQATLWGLTMADRLVVVYAPTGLNDTAHAGGGCCCCGGNEIRNAQQINTNILVYALTH